MLGNLEKKYLVLCVALLVLLGGAALWPQNTEKTTLDAITETRATDDDQITAHDATVRTQIRDGLVPHKALYEINMTSNRSGSQVLNVEGEMFFEWRPACDAWLTDHRFSLYYDYTDSPRIHVVSDFSAYETFDGTSFDFNSVRKRNGETYKEVRGQARMLETQDERIAEALYTRPEDLRYDLNDNTYFPVSHTIELIQRARAGDRFFNAYLFDGGDEEGPIQVNSFIGEKANPMASIPVNENIDTTLINTDAYHMRLAFFPADENSNEPDYEIDMIFHENGIISHMDVDYPEFSVSQKLLALEEIDELKCD